MQRQLEAALANPWNTLRAVIGDPLHPGGREATATLLDRADVEDGTRLLDVGCGSGAALELGRRRGAHAVGLDQEPAGDDGRSVRGDLLGLPVRDDTVDVVLAECVLCLADDLDRALSEIRRVTTDDGRLALSDVVVDGDVPDLPDPITEALCLDGPRDREELLDRIERAGFTVGGVRAHREDLLAMRDEVAATIDYEGLLGVMGERGQRLLDGITDLEDAVENGRVDYISLVATATA